VQQGFIASMPPFETFSEAVIVSFDAAVISLSVLTEIHLRTHASGADHSMRGKYRSAVYVYYAAQREATETVLKALQEGFDAPLVTQVLDFVEFTPSEARFQNYYASGPERPFCKTYIDPKLDKLRKMFGEHYKCRD